MTCIYDAWASKIGHKNIRLQTEPIGNLELFCDYYHIEADLNKSRKVVTAICRKISKEAYIMIFRCAMSCAPDKLDRIYRFLLLGFAYPKEVTVMLQHPIVQPVFELNRKVMNEVHLFREFIRFQPGPQNILVSVIEPKSNLLTLLAPAFEDRIPSENWMIIDKNRSLAAVHPKDSETYLTALTPEEFQEMEHSLKKGDPYAALWKDFFQTLAIEQRKNPVCQRTHIPVWYRKHATEFL